jgi:hypothetical protein
MGEVRDRPNIIITLRVTPISNAATTIIAQSLDSIFSGCSQILGIHDNRAATISDAVIIAMGDIYRPNSKL